MIFHDYAKGSFIGHICVRLESLGLENSRGNVKWQARKIRDILKEETYCGNSIYPTLISRELYDQVQAQFRIRNSHKRYETDEDVKKKIHSFILKCSNVRIADLYIKEFREESEGKRGIQFPICFDGTFSVWRMREIIPKNYLE